VWASAIQIPPSIATSQLARIVSGLADGGRRAALARDRDRDLPPERRYGEAVPDLLALVLVREVLVREEAVREEPVRDEPAREAPVREAPAREEAVREALVRDPPLA
jgi:hypothetical protein